MPILIAGISWYERENYAACREVMVDKDILPPNYDIWRKRAEAQEEKAKVAGFRVVRVLLDADTFVAWCNARGMDVDGKARQRFASEAAMRQADN